MQTSELLKQLPPQVQTTVDALLSLSVHQQGFLLASGLIGYIVFSWLLKNLVVLLLRQCGLSNPLLYRGLSGEFSWLWRVVYRLYIACKRWHEFVFKASRQSTGGFASVLSVLTQRFESGHIFLGLPWAWGFKLLSPCGIRIKTHLAIIAQSGAGKSVLLLTIIAMWRGSLVVIDPKGELWRRLIRFLLRLKSVVVLSPFDPAISGQINPIDCIDRAYRLHGESVAIQWAYRIAQAFIETPPNSKQPFFTDASRGYLVGLILFVYDQFDEEERTLGTVRDLIIHGLRVYDASGELDSTPDEARKLLHKLMMESTAFSGAIAGAAAPFINAGNEVAGNLYATLQERTKILDIPSVRYMLARTTRPLHELKSRDDYALFFDVSISSLRGELKDLARLLTNLVIYTFESTPEKKGQTLFVIEELNAQGHNACVEAALPVARSYGLSIAVVAQDIQAIKSAYVDTHLAFLGNACATIWLSTSHPDNLRLLSELLGKTTLTKTDPRTGRVEHHEKDVMSAEQLGRFLSKDSGNMLVMMAGKRPQRLVLDPYYKALPVTAYDPDPDFREPLLKRLFRLTLNPKSVVKPFGTADNTDIATLSDTNRSTTPSTKSTKP